MQAREALYPIPREVPVALKGAGSGFYELGAVPKRLIQGPRFLVRLEEYEEWWGLAQIPFNLKKTIEWMVEEDESVPWVLVGEECKGKNRVMELCFTGNGLQTRIAYNDSPDFVLRKLKRLLARKAKKA